MTNTAVTGQCDDAVAICCFVSLEIVDADCDLRSISSAANYSGVVNGGNSALNGGKRDLRP